MASLPISPTHPPSSAPPNIAYTPLPIKRSSSPARPLSQAAEVEEYSAYSQPETPPFSMPLSIEDEYDSDFSSSTVKNSPPYHNAIIHETLEQRPKPKAPLHIPLDFAELNEVSLEREIHQYNLKEERPPVPRKYSNTFQKAKEDRETERNRTRADHEGWTYLRLPEMKDFRESPGYTQGRQRDEATQPNCAGGSGRDNQDTAVNERVKNEITQLKIQVAVLQNNLKHSERAREEAIRSSALIARLLSSSSSAAPCSQCDECKKEVKMLKRENSVLWKRIESKSTRISQRAVAFESNSTSSEDEFPFGHTLFQGAKSDKRSRTEFRDMGDGDEGYEGKGKGKERQDCQHSKTPSTLRYTASGPAAQAGGPSKPVNTWGQSFESNSPTVPNSPVLNPISKNVESFPGDTEIPRRLSVHTKPSSGFPSPVLARLEPGLDSPSQPTKPISPYADVGLESLEDILGDPMDGVTRSFGRVLDLENLGPGVDVELEEHVKLMNKLKNLPAPGVFKTGFETKGSFRGAEYDYTARRTFNLQSGHHGTRDYSRCAPILLARDNSSSFEQASAANGCDLPKHKSLAGLWGSAEERESAIDTHRRLVGPGDGCRMYPDFFRYGISFKPNESDRNYFRTVIISNLPSDVSLRDILHKIRGGEIVNLMLMDTTKILGSKSAMVQFVQEKAAESYVEYAFEHPITFDDEGPPVSVNLVPTATFPHYTKRNRAQRQTRCLAIPDFPEDFSLSALERDLSRGSGHRAQSLVEIYLSSRNTLHMEFSSANAAGSAFGLLQRRIYGGIEVCFENDPCSGSLGELGWPIPPRPPMLPRSLQASIDNGGSALVQQIADEQRKRLAALQNQPVNIPSFSGRDIQSSSWADEVNDEFDDSNSPASTGTDSPETPHEDLAHAIMSENLNTLLPTTHFRRPPVGLAGSKYASLPRVPAFADTPHPNCDIRRSSSFSSILTDRALSSLSPNADPLRLNRFVDTDIMSDSEGSFGQPRPQFPEQESRKQKRRRSPPRVRLDDLLASDSESSAPCSHSLGDENARTLLPSTDTYTEMPDDSEERLREELQPFVTQEGESGGEEETTSYLSPPLYGNPFYIPKGEWTQEEAQTLAGLSPASKAMYIGMSMGGRERAASWKEKLATPDKVGESSEESEGCERTMSPDSISGTFHEEEKGFIRGQRFVLAEDPFVARPSPATAGVQLNLTSTPAPEHSSSPAPSPNHTAAKTTDPDEIDLDLDSVSETGIQAQPSKTKVTPLTAIKQSLDIGDFQAHTDWRNKAFGGTVEGSKIKLGSNPDEIELDIGSDDEVYAAKGDAIVERLSPANPRLKLKMSIPSREQDEQVGPLRKNDGRGLETPTKWVLREGGKVREGMTKAAMSEEMMGELFEGTEGSWVERKILRIPNF